MPTATPSSSTTDQKDSSQPYDYEYEQRLHFAQAVATVFDEARDLLLSKHRDYGSKNIGGAPGGAVNGLRVRMHDKLARINNLVEGKHVNHESLRDSFVDLANYALIGVLVLDE